jgi:glycosyltransferase involved in cell wall biosynthesis
MRAFAELIAIIRRERFDLVHTHNAKPGVMGRIGARLAGVPCVVNTVHGFYASPDGPLPTRVALMGLEWLSARCSDLEFFQGEADLDRARRLRIVDSRTGVFLGNGADLGYFQPSAASSQQVKVLREALGIKAHHLVVGTVGRLVGEKGYRELFESAETVCRRHPDVRFLAVGDRDAAKSDALTEEEILRARENFVFTGWVDDIRTVLSVMDIFVLPSWREGVPRSAIEAAALGLPLVLSDIAGCRQIVHHGVEGLLVPPRQPQALTAAILKLVCDGNLRAEMGAAARATAVARFDETTVYETVLAGYTRLLRRKGVIVP